MALGKVLNTALELGEILLSGSTFEPVSLTRVRFVPDRMKVELKFYKSEVGWPPEHNINARALLKTVSE